MYREIEEHNLASNPGSGSSLMGAKDPQSVLKNIGKLLGTGNIGIPRDDCYIPF